MNPSFRAVLVLAAALGGCSTGANDGGGAGGSSSGSSGGNGGSTSSSSSGGGTSSGGSSGAGGTSSGGSGSGSTSSGGSSGGAASSSGAVDVDAGDSDASASDGGGVEDAGASSEGGALAPSPLLAILDQFTAPDVPVTGPGEAAPIAHSWLVPNVPTLPGAGLAQHPMLYTGEGYNAVVLVNHGKIVWTYTAGAGGEIDDIWMLSNAHVLIAFQHHVLEVTPKKDIVWHYDPPVGTEVHTCQPIGLDKVLLMQNGLPPKLMIINKTTGVVEVEHAMDAVSLTDPTTVHPQFRRVRMTAAGTFLAPYLKMNKVVEYDKNFNPIWTYPMATPWAAVRLHNGNTLITDESERTTREVDPKSQTVWEFTHADVPAGLLQQNTQTADRLSNGDTVIFSSQKPMAINMPNLQLIEVGPDKKAVWALEDWKDLGPATTAQFLDEPGIPENPGDLQH